MSPRRLDDDLPEAPTTLERIQRRRAALLGDLGLSSSDRPVVTLPSRLLPTVAAIPLLAFPLLLMRMSANAPLRMGEAVVLLAVAAFCSAFPTSLQIGADGLSLRWLGRGRFVPWREVSAFEVADVWLGRFPGLRVVLRSGRPIDLCTSMGAFFWIDGWAERDTLLALLRASAAEAAARAGDTEPPELARRGRSFAAWARALRSIGHGANATARNAPVPAERLLRIVENPAAPAVTRAAAAVALRPALDDETRKRFDSALRSTVDPGVREALQAARAADDEEAMAEALALAEEAGERGAGADAIPKGRLLL